MERTFIMVKPNGVARGLVGEVVGRFERRGLALRAMKLMRVSRELAESHYAEHRDKPFFKSVVDFITSGPVVAMVSGAGEAYAAVSRCSPSSPCAGPGQLYRSPIGGNSWAEAPGLPGQFDVEAG